MKTLDRLFAETKVVQEMQPFTAQLSNAEMRTLLPFADAAIAHAENVRIRSGEYSAMPRITRNQPFTLA